MQFDLGRANFDSVVPGTCVERQSSPGVETPGYCRLSLRDNGIEAAFSGPRLSWRLAAAVGLKNVLESSVVRAVIGVAAASPSDIAALRLPRKIGKRAGKSDAQCPLSLRDRSRRDVRFR